MFELNRPVLYVVIPTYHVILLVQKTQAIQPLLEQLARAWCSGRPTEHNLGFAVVDNLNITIGRLACAAFPAKGAPVLPKLGADFLQWGPVWCHGLTQLPDNADKYEAELGLLAMCSKHLNGIMQVFTFLGRGKIRVLCTNTYMGAAYA